MAHYHLKQGAWGKGHPRSSKELSLSKIIQQSSSAFNAKNGITDYQSLSGAVDIDVQNLKDDTYILLTGNTTITWVNTPAVGRSIVKSFIVKSQTTETLTLPVADISKGEFTNDGAEHQISVKFSNFPNEGLKIVQFINKA